MLLLHHPYAVDHLSILDRTKQTNRYDRGLRNSLNSCSAICVLHLVVRDLLQIQMGGVDHLHSGVAVVSAAEGAPVLGVRRERVSLLSAALWRKADLLEQRHVPSTRPW